MHELWSCIAHQGDVYEATASAVPFQLGLAGVARVHRRDELVAIVAAAAGSPRRSRELDEVHRVLRASGDRLSELLIDPDIKVALHAAAVVAALPDPSPPVLQALPELGARVEAADHVAAVALAAWTAGFATPETALQHAITATEASLTDELPHLRAALDGSGPLDALARGEAVAACWNLARR